MSSADQPQSEKRTWLYLRWASRIGLLGGGIDVFGLGQAGQLILVARQAAEENGTTDAQDGGAPAEAVRPGVVIVTLEDQLVEFDGVDDQSDYLENHCRERGEGEKVCNTLKLTHGNFITSKLHKVS